MNPGGKALECIVLLLLSSSRRKGGRERLTLGAHPIERPAQKEGCPTPAWASNGQGAVWARGSLERDRLGELDPMPHIDPQGVLAPQTWLTMSSMSH